MQNNKIDWKRAIILGGAFMATCIGSGFATGSEFLSFFVAHGIPGAAGAIAISLIIYFLFTKELFNKGQEVSEADQPQHSLPITLASQPVKFSTGSAPFSSAAAT